MSRAASLAFAMTAYAVFFATFLYLIIFVGDFDLGPLSPKTVDNPPSELPLAAAIAVDVALIALFGLQQRATLKGAWIKTVPPQIERSMYLLVTSAALIIFFRLWQPVDAVLWTTSYLLHDLLLLVFWAGFVIVLVSTFLINHFELLGLQQAGLSRRRQEPPSPSFRAPLFYRWVRHPIYAGFFLIFWASPEMTVGHLLLAVGMSIYMLIAIRDEERELIARHGRDYEEYRDRAGMLTPRFRRRPKDQTRTPA